MVVYYKFLHENLKHHGFQYKEGLNVDDQRFEYYGCTGFEVYKEADLLCRLSWTKDRYWLAEVEIPKDAKTMIDSSHIKADRIILKNFRKISDFISKYDPMELLKKHDGFIKYIKNPTEEMITLAVKGDGKNIKYVKNPSEELCWLALGNEFETIGFIENPTEEMCMAALHNFREMKNPSEAVCLAAMELNGMNLEYCKNQTREICLAAVNQDYHAYRFVKKSSPEIDQVALEGLANDDTEPRHH